MVSRCSELSQLEIQRRPGTPGCIYPYYHMFYTQICQHKGRHILKSVHPLDHCVSAAAEKYLHWFWETSIDHLSNLCEKATLSVCNKSRNHGIVKLRTKITWQSLNNIGPKEYWQMQTTLIQEIFTTSSMVIGWGWKIGNSRMDYCISLLSGVPNNSLENIQLI